MKIPLIAGFLLFYVLFLPLSRVKYFTFFSLHAVVSLKTFCILKAVVMTMMIIMRIVSLYLTARVVEQHLKPLWASEVSLITSRI